MLGTFTCRQGSGLIRATDAPKTTVMKCYGRYAAICEFVQSQTKTLLRPRTCAILFKMTRGIR